MNSKDSKRRISCVSKRIRNSIQSVFFVFNGNHASRLVIKSNWYKSSTPGWLDSKAMPPLPIFSTFSSFMAFIMHTISSILFFFELLFRATHLSFGFMMNPTSVLHFLIYASLYLAMVCLVPFYLVPFCLLTVYLTATIGSYKFQHDIILLRLFFWVHHDRIEARIGGMS